MFSWIWLAKSKFTCLLIYQVDPESPARYSMQSNRSSWDSASSDPSKPTITLLLPPEATSTMLGISSCEECSKHYIYHIDYCVCVCVCVCVYVYVYIYMKWHVAKYGDPYSEHTHTPGAVSSHIAAAPGEQLGVRCTAQGSWYWRWKRALDIYFPHLQSPPDLRLEPVTFGLQVRLSIH